MAVTLVKAACTSTHSIAQLLAAAAAQCSSCTPTRLLHLTPMLPTAAIYCLQAFKPSEGLQKPLLAHLAAGLCVRRLATLLLFSRGGRPSAGVHGVAAGLLAGLRARECGRACTCGSEHGWEWGHKRCLGV